MNKLYDVFKQIKQKTKGIMSVEAYYTIYKKSLEAQEGVIIDIGPAQGGSTISVAMGIKNSNKNSKIFTFDKFKKSRHKFKDQVDLNIETFKNNLNDYNLLEYVQVYQGDIKTQKIDYSKPFVLMYIDDDSKFERDFEMFYNNLLVNSSIIIHDYRDLNLDKKNIKLNLKNGDDRPLGKEQIVYRYVNYLMDSNLISFDKIVGYTIFTKKCDNLFTIKNKKEMLEIQRQTFLEAQNI